jgi:hypothetical protein
MPRRRRSISGRMGCSPARRARVFVEMGTMSPDHIRALAAAAPDGVRIIDAPVSGATQAAAEAQLADHGRLHRGRGRAADAGLRRDRQTGPSASADKGAGAVMKLAVNALIHGLNQTLAEAMCLAEAAGIAPDRRLRRDRSERGRGADAEVSPAALPRRGGPRGNLHRGARPQGHGGDGGARRAPRCRGAARARDDWRG